MAFGQQVVGPHEGVPVYVAWCRIGRKWRVVGECVIRMFAWEICRSYAAMYHGEVITRCVLLKGKHPYGPSDLELGELPEWDGKSWGDDQNIF